MKTEQKDWSDQHSRRQMWEDFFWRKCPTKRDVINSAVSALVLREAECANLRARLSGLTKGAEEKTGAQTPPPERLYLPRGRDDL